jgi:hypothetical protein
MEAYREGALLKLKKKLWIRQAILLLFCLLILLKRSPPLVMGKVGFGL